MSEPLPTPAPSPYRPGHRPWVIIRPHLQRWHRVLIREDTGLGLLSDPSSNASPGYLAGQDTGLAFGVGPTSCSNISHVAASAIPMRLKYPWNSANSSKIRTALRSHRCLHYSLLDCPSFTNHLRFQHSHRKLNCVIHNEISKHEANLAKNLSKSPKPFWSYVRSRIAYIPLRPFLLFVTVIMSW